jgi:DNA-binding MarR family transcriptional regulator
VDEIARFLDVREEAVERALATAQFAGKIEQFKVPGRGVFWRAVHFKAAARRARLSNKARLLLASLPSDGEVDFAELSRLSGVSEHYVATLAQTLEDRGYVARRKHGGIIFISRLVDKAIPPVPAPPPAPEPLAVPRLEALSKQASLLYSHVPAGSELNLQELVAISGLGKTYVGALARALEEKGYVVRRPQGNRIFVSRAAS